MSSPPPEVLAQLKEWSDQIDASLKAGECPKCHGKNIKGDVDARQAGASRTVGVWVQYRCPDCKYMVDVKQLGQTGSA